MPKRKRVNIDQLTAGDLRDAAEPRIRYDATRRLAERDERIAADTRTALQELLGEPPPTLCALKRTPLPQPKRMPTEDDVHAAMAFARIVSARLERIAKVSRERVRLRRDD